MKIIMFIGLVFLGLQHSFGGEDSNQNSVSCEGSASASISAQENLRVGRPPCNSMKIQAPLVQPDYFRLNWSVCSSDIAKFHCKQALDVSEQDLYQCLINHQKELLNECRTICIKFDKTIN